MLMDFTDFLTPSNGDDKVLWPSARVWNDALRENGAERPSTIENIALSDSFWLSGQILPSSYATR